MSRKPKLDEEQVAEILRLYATDRRNSNLVLAEMFGVSPSTIGLIVRREVWQHVPMPTVKPEDVVVVGSLPRAGRRRIDPAAVPRDRFRSFVDERGPAECWPWTGRVVGGRGMLSYPGNPNTLAPRLAWAIANEADPGDLDVLHSCDNPICVNPAHLRTGTPKENAADRIGRGRGVLPVPKKPKPRRIIKEMDVESARRKARNFEAKYEIKPSGCWEWTGAGKAADPPCPLFGVGDGLYPAARVAWVLHHGADPGQFFVCHTCDNRLCVNPAHLFLGTPKDNMDDMRAKGRAKTGERRRGEASHKSKVTEDVVRTIRDEYGRRIATQRELAERYGLSQRQIWMIVARRSWAHVA